MTDNQEHHYLEILQDRILAAKGDEKVRAFAVAERNLYNAFSSTFHDTDDAAVGLIALTQGCAWMLYAHMRAAAKPRMEEFAGELILSAFADSFKRIDKACKGQLDE